MCVRQDACLGVLLGSIGTDVNTGTQRLTFGIIELFDGLSLPVVAMGLFGVSEVISSVGRVEDAGSRNKVSFRSMIPTRDDIRRSLPAWLRGSLLGSFLGAVPGVGGAIAAFAAYAVERNVTRYPEQFGKGAIEGVVSPEAANNAAGQTSFIPTMSLGIPGSAVMALMVGALMIHGIAPGPRLVSEHPDLFWGLIMSFWVGNLMLLILNIPLIGVWVRLLTIPYQVMYPAILMFVCVGAFALNNSAATVYFVLLFGLLGYGMRSLDLPAAPLLLGLVLGPMLEENLRRALVISQGDFTTFVQRPLSAAFLIATVFVLAWVIWGAARERELAA
ncbi:tripartite tricarboxylate transporter permease [Sinorhizobium meliloti]|uniref:tripartite tricarboxylate transporter permease n=1 Tax=Rhizobium meliloti TaxID=382 RepID=UPI003D648EBA